MAFRVCSNVSGEDVAMSLDGWWMCEWTNEACSSVGKRARSHSSLLRLNVIDNNNNHVSNIVIHWYV